MLCLLCAFVVPSQEFVAPVLEDLDPENAIESDYTRIRQDPVYAWKVLRMMSRTHFEKMDSIKVRVYMPHWHGQGQLLLKCSRVHAYAETSLQSDAGHMYITGESAVLLSVFTPGFRHSQGDGAGSAQVLS